MPKQEPQMRKVKRVKLNDALYIPGVLMAETLTFCSQIPALFIKHTAEVLMKTAASCTITVNQTTLTLTAADIESPTQISVEMTLNLTHCVLPCEQAMTRTLDTGELVIVTKSLRKKDKVFVYFTSSNIMGVVTETSNHVKNSLLNTCVSPVVKTHPLIDLQGVEIPSPPFQRMLGDFRDTTKKLKISGNETYSMFEIEQSNSLHRTDSIETVISDPVFRNAHQGQRVYHFSSAPFCSSSLCDTMRHYFFFVSCRGLLLP